LAGKRWLALADPFSYQRCLADAGRGLSRGSLS
jgi:hypothetical protein